MIDEQWIKNLVLSELNPVSKNLMGLNKADIENQAIDKIKDSISQLHNITSESIKVFNFHAPNERALKLFSSQNKDLLTTGFYLLISNIQTSVNMKEYEIQVEITQTKDYSNDIVFSKVYRPFVDHFGGVLWKDDQSAALLDYELIAKDLLEKTLLFYHKNQGLEA